MPSHEPHGAGAGCPWELNKSNGLREKAKRHFGKSGRKDVIIPCLVGLIGRNNSRMTDKELAQEVVQRGSHKAFAEIVHRYSGMVFSKALGVMRTEEGAAEVTQQAES